MGCDRNISRDLRHRLRISLSDSCTFFPGRAPRTGNKEKQGKSRGGDKSGWCETGGKGGGLANSEVGAPPTLQQTRDNAVDVHNIRHLDGPVVPLPEFRLSADLCYCYLPVTRVFSVYVRYVCYFIDGHGLRAPVCVCAVSVCGWQLASTVFVPSLRRMRGFTASDAGPSAVGCFQSFRSSPAGLLLHLLHFILATYYKIFSTVDGVRRGKPM